MRHRRVRSLPAPVTVALAATLFLAACGDDDADDPANDATDDMADDPANDVAEGGAQVDIVDNGFDPGEVEVAQGDTVVWEHTGSIGHTVTFDDGEDSGSLGGGDTYERTFDESGEYPYVCSIHPAMQGTVTVTG